MSRKTNADTWGLAPPDLMAGIEAERERIRRNAEGSTNNAPVVEQAKETPASVTFIDHRGVPRTRPRLDDRFEEVPNTLTDEERARLRAEHEAEQSRWEDATEPPP